MEESYFVKVGERSSLEDVLASMRLQEKRSLKKIRYCSVAQIQLADEEFQSMLYPITQSHNIYVKFGPSNAISCDGSLRCITLTNSSEGAHLVVYTAGRTFPLYVSYEES